VIGSEGIPSIALLCGPLSAGLPNDGRIELGTEFVDGEGLPGPEEARISAKMGGDVSLHLHALVEDKDRLLRTGLDSMSR